MTATEALALLDQAIHELEARLNLQPGQEVVIVTKEQSSAPSTTAKSTSSSSDKNINPTSKASAAPKKPPKVAAGGGQSGDAVSDLPMILQLEFKVGQITKVWEHPTADKLYCEEIDVGEAQPRQIASGLRPHFTLEQMMGQRLVVVSNLKPKNLVGFKSHGMVLCAVQPDPSHHTGERVEFVEPPPDAALGEVISWAGLPPPQPATPAQVDKKKMWVAGSEGLHTTAERLAAWQGHVMTTSAGPCRTASIADGILR